MSGPRAALDHVQVAIPPGGEAAGRRFYADLLGLTEVAKPAALRAAGGVWFAEGLHLGVEAGFTPARKAHPAFRIDDLNGVAAALAAAGHRIEWDDRIAGVRRVHADDPFGNRVELIAAQR